LSRRLGESSFSQARVAPISASWGIALDSRPFRANGRFQFMTFGLAKQCQIAESCKIGFPCWTGQNMAAFLNFGRPRHKHEKAVFIDRLLVEMGGAGQKIWHSGVFQPFQALPQKVA
jgi:hypothetical protein